MTTKKITAFVAVVMMVFFTSCEDSSFVGLNSVEMQSVPTVYTTDEVEKTYELVKAVLDKVNND